MKYSIFTFFLLLAFSYSGYSQSDIDKNKAREYSSLEEALKSPEDVYRLNLSNQTIDIADTLWASFTNLEYLSLKNDHLKQIPSGVGNLKNLKVLDLSGNDFKKLPSSFSNLTNLQELYLNDDRNFEFNKSITILSTLPNLKSLHIENDGLNGLPPNMYMLRSLESLYLNSNQFKQFPIQIKDMESLQFLDMRNNKYDLPRPDILNEQYGLKISF